MAASVGTREGLEKFESGSRRRCDRGLPSGEPTLLLLVVAAVQISSRTRLCVLPTRGMSIESDLVREGTRNVLTMGLYWRISGPWFSLV